MRFVENYIVRSEAWKPNSNYIPEDIVIAEMLESKAATQRTWGWNSFCYQTSLPGLRYLSTELEPRQHRRYASN